MKKTYCAEMAPQPLFTLFTSSKPQKRNLYRVHQHTELELGWILRGEGEYILDGASYDAQPGDLFLVRGNEQHCIPTIRTPTLDAFNIHLTVPYLWGTAADYADPARLRRLVGTGDVPHRFRGDAVLNGLLTQLMDSAQSDAPESRFAVRRTMIALIAALADRLPPDGSAPAAAAHWADIQRALALIDGHFTEPLTLDRMAREARLSRSHFSAEFKSVTGIAPYEYVLLRRIERAVRLLRTTDDTVLAVAQDCGFRSLASFNKLFKKITGVVPSALRKPV